jgi:malate dehydrogenase (oxaloacetate-decarboxylating)(NADP+)
VIVSGARRVTDTMFYVAARTLANQVSDASLAEGRLFPRLTDIRLVSATLAVAVAEVAWQEGLATVPRPADVMAAVLGSMYDATYPDYA